MKIRTKLQLWGLLAGAIPAAVLGIGFRGEMKDRLTDQYNERMRTLAEVIRADLDREHERIQNRLEDLGQRISEDNLFRLNLISPPDGSNTYLADYAGRTMGLASLATLRVVDASGLIISSGHFRNEFGLTDELFLTRVLSVGRAPFVVEQRTSSGAIVAVSSVDSTVVGGRKLYLVGGSRLDDLLTNRRLESELRATIQLPGREPQRFGEDNLLLDALSMPYLPSDEAPIDSALITISHDLVPLQNVLEELDVWILYTVLATAGIAALAATFLAGRLSSPLTDLARKTEQLDLDRLDEDFTTDRDDEVGALTRLLGELTGRIRASVTKLRDTERRATVGEIARQVNHDIKNGLIPIRNVMRHLFEVARDDPDQLPEVLAERRNTLESSVGYLERLASNYARLYPQLDIRPCDLNALAASLADALATPETVDIELQLAPDLPDVRADEVVLRRILENLFDNAVESLGSSGTISVTTGYDSNTGMVRIDVRDSGSGMTEEQLERAFEDFYTTKDRGTGLGLSVVRRLVLDLEGKLRVETEPGSGTTFTVELPSTGNGRNSTT